jgi:zinc transport system substrate-binding protein
MKPCTLKSKAGQITGIFIRSFVHSLGRDWVYRKISKMLILAFVGIVMVTGCGQMDGNASEGVQSTGSKAESDIQAVTDTGLSIVTSFYPVYIATINVAADIPGVTVQNMTKPQTGCLHDYALKPEDLKTLEKADVFVVNGAGMEAFLNDVIKRQKDLKMVTASRGIELLKDESGAENPHVWVSISNAITYVNNIALQLSDIDPANKNAYRSNANAYIQKLELLRKDMHTALDGLKNRDIVTFHEAFPYFAREFELNIAAVVEREPGSEPTPKELAGIIDTVEQSGVRALFAEPQYSSKAADAIARETGAKVYTLDPVVTGDVGPDTRNAYIRAMEQNKKTLLEAMTAAS